MSLESVPVPRTETATVESALPTAPERTRDASWKQFTGILHAFQVPKDQEDYLTGLFRATLDRDPAGASSFCANLEGFLRQPVHYNLNPAWNRAAMLQSTSAELGIGPESLDRLGGGEEKEVYAMNDYPGVVCRSFISLQEYFFSRLAEYSEADFAKGVPDKRVVPHVVALPGKSIEFMEIALPIGDVLAEARAANDQPFIDAVNRSIEGNPLFAREIVEFGGSKENNAGIVFREENSEQVGYVVPIDLSIMAAGEDDARFTAAQSRANVQEAIADARPVPIPHELLRRYLPAELGQVRYTPEDVLGRMRATVQE